MTVDCRPAKLPVVSSEGDHRVLAYTRPITPSYRLTFTVKDCLLLGPPYYVFALVSTKTTYLHHDNASNVRSDCRSVTRHTRARYKYPGNPTKMAPNYGQAAPRTAHHNARDEVPPNISSANSIRLGLRGHHTSARRECERARQTRRKRDTRTSRNQMVSLPSPTNLAPSSSRSRFTDRMTYSEDGEDQGSISYRHGASPLPQTQRGRILQENTRKDSVSRDDGLVQPDWLHGGQSEAENIDNNSENDTGMDVNDFADLCRRAPFSPYPPRQPVSTRPMHYGSAFHLPINRFVHPPRPVLPATRREPTRMLNAFGPSEPDVEIPAHSSEDDPPSKTTVTAIDAKKHPVNKYKGNDPIKKRVQNKRLQLVLSGRPMPKPRKKPDRMILKCTGKQEFR